MGQESWARQEKREVGAVRQANKDTWDKHMGRKIGTEMFQTPQIGAEQRGGKSTAKA